MFLLCLPEETHAPKRPFPPLAHCCADKWRVNDGEIHRSAGEQWLTGVLRPRRTGDASSERMRGVRVDLQVDSCPIEELNDTIDER